MGEAILLLELIPVFAPMWVRLKHDMLFIALVSYQEWVFIIGLWSWIHLELFRRDHRLLLRSKILQINQI